MDECILCAEEKDEYSISICEKCYNSIWKTLGFKIKDGERIPKDKLPIVRLVEQVGLLSERVDYLLHAIENHKHGIKAVDTVDID